VLNQKFLLKKQHQYIYGGESVEKEIKNFPDYKITDDGKVISLKYKKQKVMKTWLQKNGYENIVLSKNGERFHFLVHRLVASAFIENELGLPEVNHKNKIRKDNRVENLEWCTRMENLKESYETLGPTRNFRCCFLINQYSKEKIGFFNSICEAATFAKKNFGCSESGMKRNYKSKGYEIIFEECND
jgi:hypothetical protein